MTNVEVMTAVERAREGRVDLGAFSVEELWRAGVELTGARPRQDPPPASRLPLGPRAFRQLDAPPLPRLVSLLAAEDAELAEVHHDAVLIDRSIAKVIETRSDDQQRRLSLQPLDTLLDDLLAGVGFTLPAASPWVLRLFFVFPLRFKWAKGKGLLPSQRLFVAKAPMPKDQALWLDLQVRTGPGVAPAVTEKRSERASAVPSLPAGADADGIKAHVRLFLDTLWDVPGPGPRP